MQPLTVLYEGIIFISRCQTSGKLREDQMPTKKLLTTEEAAAFLGIQPQTLVNWRSTGRVEGLAYIKVGHAVRYRPEDLTAYIEDQRVGELAGAK